MPPHHLKGPLSSPCWTDAQLLQTPFPRPCLGLLFGGRLQLASMLVPSPSIKRAAAAGAMVFSPEETVRLGAKQSGLEGGKV